MFLVDKMDKLISPRRLWLTSFRCINPHYS